MKKLLMSIAFVLTICFYSHSASAIAINVPELDKVHWGDTSAEISQKYSLNSLVSIKTYTLSTPYELYGRNISQNVELCFFNDNLYTVYIAFKEKLSLEAYESMVYDLAQKMGKSVGTIDNTVDEPMVFWIDKDVIVGLSRTGITYTSLSLTRKLLANDEVDFKEWQNMVVSKAETSQK